MQADPSSLLVIALLAFAASLASYSVAISPYFRKNRPVAWTGFGIGTALLIAATVIMVLTTSHWTAIIAQPSDGAAALPTGSGIQFPDSGASSNDTAISARTATATRTTLGAPVRPNASSRAASDGERSSARAADAPDPVARFSRDYRAQLTSVQSFGPWGATRCVYAVRPDPAEPSRWWLENDCNVAVAIVFAGCDGNLCDVRGAPAWRYPDRLMLLPSKAQRSATFAERTGYGEHIRYAACTILTPSVAALVGSDPVTHDTFSQLHARDDECLAGAQTLLMTGQGSRKPLDSMVGGVPGGILH